MATEDMHTTVARFADLEPIDYSSFIKNYRPDGTQGYALIGKAGKTKPPIAGDHGFYMGINKVSPGKGAPLHSPSQARGVRRPGRPVDVFLGRKRRE